MTEADSKSEIPAREGERERGLFALLVTMKWSDMLVDVVVPLVGIALIAVYVLSFFLAFGQRMAGNKQLIKAYGLEVQVSVRTLLMLAGLALTFTSVFVHIQQTQVQLLNGQVSDLNAKLDAAREEAARAGRHVVRAFLVPPPGINAAALDLSELECRYVLGAKPDQPIQALLMKGLGGSSLMIIMSDVRRDDVIQQIELREKGSNEVLGVARNIYPLQPVIKLQREQP